MEGGEGVKVLWGEIQTPPLLGWQELPLPEACVTSNNFTFNDY